MPRFPVDAKSIVDNKAVITGTDHRHIIKALRLKAGDAITLFDSDSTEY